MSSVAQVSTVSKNVEKNADTTITIFDSFYNTNLYVNGAEYDTVNSYFYGVTGNNIIAANYAAILFRIAQEGNYNVFGQVISGQDVADRISNVPTGPQDRPVTPVVIESITIAP